MLENLKQNPLTETDFMLKSNRICKTLKRRVG